jgi:hypothetical protein
MILVGFLKFQLLLQHLYFPVYNDVTYDQVSIKHGGSDYFKTDMYSGEVTSNHTPYEEDMRYFVRVVCKDSDPKEDFSG